MLTLLQLYSIPQTYFQRFSQGLQQPAATPRNPDGSVHPPHSLLNSQLITMSSMFPIRPDGDVEIRLSPEIHDQFCLRSQDLRICSRYLDKKLGSTWPEELFTRDTTQVQWVLDLMFAPDSPIGSLRRRVIAILFSLYDRS